MKAGTVIIISVVGAGLIVGAYFLFKKPSKKNSPNGSPIAPPVPTNAAGFPLTPNMTGNLITNLQNGLNTFVLITPDIPVTGVFDSATATALATVGYNPLSVSQNDYNEIIAPATSSNTSTTPATSGQVSEAQQNALTSTPWSSFFMI